MKILVVAAKDVGLECVRFLIETYPDDDYEFIVTDPGATAIEALLKENGRDCRSDTTAALAEVTEQPQDHYDWFLNLWGGAIYRDDVLSRARRSVNIHPGYLPHGRGRDPVVWAIRKEEPAGLALHALTKGVDEGPVWYRERVDYTLPCDGGGLYDRVIQRCWEAFIEQWPKLRETTQEPVPQEEELSTTKRKDLFADRDIDADVDPSVRDFVLRLLAHDFGPGYTARVRLNGKLYDATLNLNPSQEEE